MKALDVTGNEIKVGDYVFYPRYDRNAKYANTLHKLEVLNINEDSQLIQVQDAVLTGSQLGINSNNSMTFAADANGNSKAYQYMSTRSMRHRSC